MRTAADVLEFLRSMSHVKGPLAGHPFLPDPWQIDDIIRPLFDAHLPDGRRRYRTAYVEVPRKNGKSTLAATLALYLLLADEEQGPEVISAAADREQASITFDIARGMVEASPFAPYCKILRKEIVVPRNGGRYRAISADAFTKHGMNCHGIIFDELHAQPDRELWDVLTTSTGARTQPLTFAITTAGYDRSSICWELHCYAEQVKKGIIDDPTFLPVIYSAEPEEDWSDPAVWRKANPGFGISVQPDYFERSVAEAKASPAREQAFRRLHLNQWTESETRWLSMDRWDTCAGAIDLDELQEQECYAGLDLASTTDLASLVLLFPQPEGSYVVLPFFWVPEEALRRRGRENRAAIDPWVRSGHIETTPGDVIDYDLIRKKINDLADLYRIREVALDRWNATHISTQLQGDGFAVIAYGQGYASMSAPTKELEKLVLAEKLAHGRHPVLRWNAANVVVEQDAAGNLKPSKKKSTEKIDGIVALIMALGRAMLRPEISSVYETRGTLTLETAPVSRTPDLDDEEDW